MKTNGIESCPVIKGVNEDEVKEIQQQNGEEEQTGAGGALSDAFDFDSEFANDIPSIAAYKKMRKIMKLITGFYGNGTKTKREQYESMCVFDVCEKSVFYCCLRKDNRKAFFPCLAPKWWTVSLTAIFFWTTDLEEDLKRVSFDIYQSKEQLKVLESEENIKFRGHLKWKEYVQELKDEAQRLEAERVEIEIKRDHYKTLSVWSEKIVSICEWLELNLDDFANRNITDLPEALQKETAENAAKLRALSDEEVQEFSKGLDEITHNLTESRDFFEASVDGRMTEYQSVQAEIIECQLRALEQFPSEDNPRRDYIEATLQEDLEYIHKQIRDAATAPVQNRRQRMLKMHKDFLQVLKFFTDKLHVLKLDPSKRSYDPQFTDLFTA